MLYHYRGYIRLHVRASIIILINSIVRGGATNTASTAMAILVLKVVRPNIVFAVSLF